jgi:hypothetical protein
MSQAIRTGRPHPLLFLGQRPSRPAVAGSYAMVCRWQRGAQLRVLVPICHCTLLERDNKPLARRELCCGALMSRMATTAAANTSQPAAFCGRIGWGDGVDGIALAAGARAAFHLQSCKAANSQNTSSSKTVPASRQHHPCWTAGRASVRLKGHINVENITSILKVPYDSNHPTVKPYNACRVEALTFGNRNAKKS